MNTQLTKQNGNTAIAMPEDYIPVAGIENLSPDDFSIPVVKLVQSNTGIDNADELVGQWYRTDTGEVAPELKTLIIGIQKSRILFPSEYSGDGKALCRSDDSITPRADHAPAVYYLAGNEKRRTQISEMEGGNFDMTIPATCAECPLSQWGVNGEKPPCRLSDNWAALTSEGDPVLIRFGGSAAKISAKLRNLARAASAKRRPLYVQLSSHFETGKIGQYYVPDLTLLKEPLPADLLDTAKAFVGLNLAARAAEMAVDDETEQGGETGYKIKAMTDPDWSQLNDEVPATELEF
jgi:hypothetical protein